jgi:hypothetical protein
LNILNELKKIQKSLNKTIKKAELEIDIDNALKSCQNKNCPDNIEWASFGCAKADNEIGGNRGHISLLEKKRNFVYSCRCCKVPNKGTWKLKDNLEA